MANKKNLSSVDMGATDTGITTGAVISNLERGRDRHGQQGTASAEEKQQRESQLKTRGRKGCKLQRISIGFSPDNIQLIYVMTSVLGQSTTEFLNNLLDEYRKQNAEDIEAAARICERLKTSKGK